MLGGGDEKCLLVRQKSNEKWSGERVKNERVAEVKLAVEEVVFDLGQAGGQKLLSGQKVLPAFWTQQF